MGWWQAQRALGLRGGLSFSLADIGVIFAICGSLCGGLFAVSNSRYADKAAHTIKHQAEYGALTMELRTAQEEMKAVRKEVAALLCFLEGGSQIGGRCLGRRTGDLPPVGGRVSVRPVPPPVRFSAPKSKISSPAGEDPSVGAPHAPEPSSPNR